MSAQITFTSTVPRTGDTQLIALQKILQQLRETTISGSGGSSGVLSGHGAPSTDPGVTNALYYDLDDGQTYQWNDETGAWV